MISNRSILASLLPLIAAVAAETKVVVAGENGLSFEPESITAEVGDTVEFRFWPQRHSVGRSSFDTPCEPLAENGFFSDYIPVSEGVADDTFTITINSTDPIWYYCPTDRHCQGGMVGVINPPSDGPTFDEFSSNARAAENAVVPDEIGGGTVGPSAQQEGEDSEPTPSASGSASSTASESAAAATTSSGAAERAVAFAPLGFAAAIAGLVLA